MKAGDKVFLRTVTSYFLGRVVEPPTGGWVTLTEAIFVAYTGDFEAFLKTAEASKAFHYPEGREVHVNLASVVDWNVMD